MAEDYYGGNDGTTANETPERRSENPGTGGRSDKKGARNSFLPKSMFHRKKPSPGHVCMNRLRVAAKRRILAAVQIRWAPKLLCCQNPCSRAKTLRRGTCAKFAW